MKSLNSNYFSRIDHIRFLAATLVVFVHSYTLYGGGESDNLFVMFMLSGDTGVSLFLVLSGVLFTIISDCGRKKIVYKIFIYNRFIRIFPLLIMAWITAISLSRGTATFSDAMTIFFFSNLQTSPLLSHFGQTWTIAVEFQFYLIFPFLAIFLNRYGVKYIVYLSIFWVFWRGIIVSIYGAQLGGDGYLNNHYYYLTMLGRLDQFLVGIIFGYIYINFKDKLKNPIIFISSVFIVFFSMIFFRNSGLWYIPTPYVASLSYPEAIVWGIFIVSYMSAGFNVPKIIDMSLSKLGEISFSEYILHGIVLYSFHKTIGVIQFSSNINTNAIINFIVVLVPILFFSKICFELIEKPFLGFRRRYTE
ncbi:acyltransferase family protein [Morganella morganii]|nr:acyltransferase [Morganella morganii]